MRARAGPFDARTMLAVIAVGAAAFLMFLYAIGAGWGGARDQDGGAHGAAKGLNGFAGLVRLLEAQGHDVSLSRSEARLEDSALLVITPPVLADAEDLSRLIERRRHFGPTLLILPKWLAAPAETHPQLDAPRGWVLLIRAVAPPWVGRIESVRGADATIAERRRWNGFGRAGSLPAPATGQALSAATLAAPDPASLRKLVTDERGDVLAGMLDETSANAWPVVIVAEPDLLNNFGLADSDRAALAVALVETALDNQVRPIVFDLTVPGLGSSRNLLTLAFEPPFLAATVCLLLAAGVIGWRGFRRFGPPVAETPALAMGKRQLARNSARLIERSRRLRLLGPPYAALISARLAGRLGIREADPAAREAAIAHALAARGLSADYAARVETLRSARKPTDLLRAAGALRIIERTLAP